MLLVPNVAVLVMEAIDLETVFKNLYFEPEPTESNCVPVAFLHAGWGRRFFAAKRQQVAHIGQCVWIECVCTSCDDILNFDSDVIPSSGLAAGLG